MKIIYECEHCGKQFSNSTCCAYHEILHLEDMDKIKYHIMNFTSNDECDYCANAYWVYGCERDCNYINCKYDNNYKYFEPRLEV